jgi:TetR/AcrR family transcriptional repressor of bet genes
MESLRRAALVEAAIHEIGAAGSLDVTVGQIARRAGMSSGLAHHYFGNKERMLLAAMRHILTIFGAQVRAALKTAHSPRQRVEAIVHASFEPGNFRPEVISAWLNFYLQALTSDNATRLLRVYQRRLRSNLLVGLRPLLGAEAGAAAEGIAAMIDGFYIRQALRETPPDGDAASAAVIAYLDTLIGARR